MDRRRAGAPRGAPQHPLPPYAYAGTYTGAALGTMQIDLRGETLEIRLGPLEATAGYYTRPDAVRVEFEPGRGEVVQFFVSGRGVDSLAYEDYVFRRATRSSGRASLRLPLAPTAGRRRAPR